MDRSKQGTDKQQGQRKPEPGPRHPGVDQPDLQRDHGDRAHPSSRPEQPDTGRKGGGMDRGRKPVERESDERRDRDAGPGRAVRLDDEDDGEATARA